MGPRMTHTFVKYLTPTKKSNLEFDLSSLWPTCQSSPHTSHTSWHTWHIHLSNIWLPNLSNLQHFCVWKHVFWVDEILKILSKIPVNTLFNALRHLKKKMRQTPQNFSLRPRGPTRNLNCFCFCCLFRKGHHCGNKLFPVSVCVILTEKPFAALIYLNDETNKDQPLGPKWRRFTFIDAWSPLLVQGQPRDMYVQKFQKT